MRGDQETQGGIHKDPEPLRHEPPAEVQKRQQGRLRRAWEVPKGLRYWSAVNNTIVGVWYTATAFIFFLFGGVLALMMRIQLAKPDNDFLTAEMYNQVFTVHGSVMMFLFAIPVFESIAVIFLPQMLGARDLPFPRLSAFGYWCFLLGGIFLCDSIFFDAAPRGGWFMYPPLTSDYQPGLGADIWLLGFSFIEIAAIAAAVELIVGALKCRPPGMRINLIPLYCWYVLVAAAMVLFAFPPLIEQAVKLKFIIRPDRQDDLQIFLCHQRIDKIYEQFTMTVILQAGSDLFKLINIQHHFPLGIVHPGFKFTDRRGRIKWLFVHPVGNDILWLDRYNMGATFCKFWQHASPNK